MSNIDIFESLEADAKAQKEIPSDEKFKQLNTLAKRFVDTKRDISVAEETVSKLKENLKQIKESDSELVQQFLKGKADGPVPFHYPAPDLKTSFLGADK